MNIMQLPTFDDSLADAAKLAAVRQVVELAIGFAEEQLGKVKEPREGQDVAAVYAMNTGLLEATVEVLVAYLGQIAGTVKPDYLPFADDLQDEEYDEWYDAQGNVDPKGAYDAGGHHFAERDGRIGCDF